MPFSFTSNKFGLRQTLCFHDFGLHRVDLVGPSTEPGSSVRPHIDMLCRGVPRRGGLQPAAARATRSEQFAVQPVGRQTLDAAVTALSDEDCGQQEARAGCILHNTERSTVELQSQVRTTRRRQNSFRWTRLLDYSRYYMQRPVMPMKSLMKRADERSFLLLDQHN